MARQSHPAEVTRGAGLVSVSAGPRDRSSRRPGESARSQDWNVQVSGCEACRPWYVLSALLSSETAKL